MRISQSLEVIFAVIAEKDAAIIEKDAEIYELRQASQLLYKRYRYAVDNLARKLRPEDYERIMKQIPGFDKSLSV